jgi:hypothetical protein
MNEMCGICNKRKSIQLKHNNYYICKYCYDLLNAENCSACGKLKPVNTRSKNGKPICVYCIRKTNTGECSECKDYKILISKKDMLCGICYSKRYKDFCSMCSLYKKIQKRIEDKPVCKTCN